MSTKHPTHLVVDGSNIATEGRSNPSLEQLDEAVRAILDEFPHDRLTVVVDATFGHRIDESERAAYEEAILAGEIVAPPAGAIGRGDAFILQVAEKAGATVFSNDSFQEFHGEHDWLFDEGRLIGGKPVPGVGWVFVPRVPVRGPLSRRAVRESRRGSRSAPRSSRSTASEAPAKRGRPRPTVPPPPPPSTRKATAPPPPPPAEEAPAEREAAAQRRGAEGTEALNEPAVFLGFIAQNSIGSLVEATVDHFSSHGAYVIADGARCYLPTKTMGDPPPNRARDIVQRGDTVRVEVQSLDAERRGINVRFVELLERAPGEAPADEDEQEPAMAAALPSGDEAGAGPRSDSDVATKKTASRRATAKKAPSGRPVPDEAAKRAPIKKAAAEATPSPRAIKAAARKAPRSGRAAAEAAEAPVKKAAARRRGAAAAPEVSDAPLGAADEAAAEATGTTRRAAPRKAATKRATSRKAAADTTAAEAPAAAAPVKRSAAKRGAARAATEQAGEAAPEAPAKKATAKRATAKKATAKKAGTKAAAKKATAKKAGTSKAAAKKATAGAAPAAEATPAAPRKAAARKATAKKAATRKAADTGNGTVAKKASRGRAAAPAADGAPAKKAAGRRGSARSSG